MEYRIELAGIPLRLETENALAEHVLDGFRTEKPAKATAASSAERIKQWKVVLAEGTPEWVAEYNELAAEASEALLPFGRCVFHGAAFVWREKAWIFTAPSGVGKTTQYALWKMQYKDEVTMLNGDKPVLECRADGGIYVHPSPWQGKEDIGSMCSARLGGIICLTRGEENSIRRMRAGEALIPVFSQIIYYAENEKTADQALKIAEQILTTVPVWGLKNVGDRASAALTHDTLMRYEERAE